MENYYNKVSDGKLSKQSVGWKTIKATCQMENCQSKVSDGKLLKESVRWKIIKRKC